MTEHNPPAAYWGQEDDEVPTALTPDAAIEKFLDWCEPLPETMTVIEYRRAVLALDSDQLIEWIDDQLREEYQHPDCDDGWDPTEEVVAAAVVFIDVIQANYLPTVCEPTGKEVTVDTAEWVRKHRPSWLTTKPQLLDHLTRPT